MDVAVTSCEYFSAVMVGVRVLYFVSFLMLRCGNGLWSHPVSLARLCLRMDGVRVLLTCMYICVFACVQGDYVLNMKELMSVSLFKIFWHNLKLLRNFFRSVFHS